MSEFERKFSNHSSFLKSIDTLCIYKFQNAIEEAQLHSHNSWEIAYVTNGKGLFYLEGQSFSVSKGTLILSKPGTRHYESSNTHDEMEIMFLMFNSTFSPRSSFGFEFPSSIVINTSEEPEIERIFHSILLETMSYKNGYDIYINSEISRLFVILYRKVEITTSDIQISNSLTSLISYRKSKIIEAIKTHMEENLSENLYIGSIASKFFISPQHLIRTFKEVTGYNPKEYITKQRIKKAMNLLNTDHLDVADVAEKVGYTSITQFYKAFKKETAMTPAQFNMLSTLELSEPDS